MCVFFWSPSRWTTWTQFQCASLSIMTIWNTRKPKQLSIMLLFNADSVSSIISFAVSAQNCHAYSGTISHPYSHNTQLPSQSISISLFCLGIIYNTKMCWNSHARQASIRNDSGEMVVAVAAVTTAYTLHTHSDLAMCELWGKNFNMKRQVIYTDDRK